MNYSLKNLINNNLLLANQFSTAFRFNTMGYCSPCFGLQKNALQDALNEAQATMGLASPPPQSPSIAGKPQPPQPNQTINKNTTNTQTDKPPTAIVQRCIVCKGPSRSGSVYCSENCIVQHSNAVERVSYKLQNHRKMLRPSLAERRSGRC